MLCLSRMTGESIIVTVPPSDKEQIIEVMPKYLRGARVGIAIGAERHISILRKELKERGQTCLNDETGE